MIEERDFDSDEDFCWGGCADDDELVRVRGEPMSGVGERHRIRDARSSGLVGDEQRLNM